MKRKHIAALVSSLLASSLSAAAEPVKAEQGVTQLKKVIVTVTRMKQNAEEVSRPIAVVERDEIDSIQPQSVAEVLVYEPNISVSGGPRANNQTVNIRGLSGNKILQTVDGVRQVFESGHRPSYFLDPELLQSVEAVKGPASTLWGSGALGGVVAQNSISASDLLEADQEIGGFVKTGYNDNNHQMSTTAVVAGRIGNVDWLVSDYYRDGNDLKLGNGKNLEGSASRDNGTLTKLEWQIDDAQSLAFNYRQSDVTE
ncbi:MAG: hemoglobin/transferrin/lactoferrin receptor protein, partial [Motiliproteus sp.]